MIPKEEIKEKLSFGYSELDREFMGFERNYIPIADSIPHDWTIVDLGCYQAAQCYLFEDHKAYIGVDIYDSIVMGGFVPPLRFRTANSRHYFMTIQQFAAHELSSFDVGKTYFIASAVPDFEATRMIYNIVRHCCVVYPGKEPMVKGYGASMITHLFKNYDDYYGEGEAI